MQPTGKRPERVAVVLFNLGGPDHPADVRPFLQNLFSDRAIIGLPAIIRLPLAWAIARKRAPAASAIYARLGGGSPLLANTRAQADALAFALGASYRVFIAMRYWRPFADQTAREVAAWAPDKIVLLPLYPQLSTTTTASSARAWTKAARAAGLTARTTLVCCYADNANLAAAIAIHTQVGLLTLGDTQPVRVLFTAHGLPERIVAAGDPYVWLVRQTVEAVVRRLDMPTLDWAVCFQSRVGPLAWIGPSTESEIDRAAADGVGVVVVPVAFVSEHSETLVELDIELRERAHRKGVPAFYRAATVGTDALFIEALKQIVETAGATPLEILASGANSGRRVCPVDRAMCACAISDNGEPA